MDTRLTRSSAPGRPVNHRLGRAGSTPIALEHLCAAVDAIPGIHIGMWPSDDPAVQLQLGVEVYDPARYAWRVLVTLADGEAWVELDELENPSNPICRGVEQLVRLLDACLATEDGVGLIRGGEQQAEREAAA